MQSKQANSLQLQTDGDEKFFVLYEMFQDCQDTNGTGASRNYICIMEDGEEWGRGKAQAA